MPFEDDDGVLEALRERLADLDAVESSEAADVALELGDELLDRRVWPEALAVFGQVAARIVDVDAEQAAVLQTFADEGRLVALGALDRDAEALEVARAMLGRYPGQVETDVRSALVRATLRVVADLLERERQRLARDVVADALQRLTDPEAENDSRAALDRGLLLRAQGNVLDVLGEHGAAVTSWQEAIRAVEAFEGVGHRDVEIYSCLGIAGALCDLDERAGARDALEQLSTRLATLEQDDEIEALDAAEARQAIRKLSTHLQIAEARRLLISDPRAARHALPAMQQLADDGEGDAWVMVASLLALDESRLDEEESAWRKAARAAEHEHARFSLVRLGELLLYEREDLASARACFARAVDGGSGEAAVLLAAIDSGQPFKGRNKWRKERERARRGRRRLLDRWLDDPTD